MKQSFDGKSILIDKFENADFTIGKFVVSGAMIVGRGKVYEMIPLRKIAHYSKDIELI